MTYGVNPESGRSNFVTSILSGLKPQKDEKQPSKPTSEISRENNRITELPPSVDSRMFQANFLNRFSIDQSHRPETTVSPEEAEFEAVHPGFTRLEFMEGLFEIAKIAQYDHIDDLDRLIHTDELYRELRNENPYELGQISGSDFPATNPTFIDRQEVAVLEPGETSFTWGISACTGLVVKTEDDKIYFTHVDAEMSPDQIKEEIPIDQAREVIVIPGVSPSENPLSMHNTLTAIETGGFDVNKTQFSDPAYNIYINPDGEVEEILD